MGWTPAGRLCIGNLLVPRAGPAEAVANVERKVGPTAVYNFEVEDGHSYFVGQAGRVWVHNNCYTILYRAVGSGEAADIAASGTLRAGNGSMSGKWLAESAEDAAAWGRQFYQLDGKPFDIVAVRFRSSSASNMFRMESLDNVGPARYLNLDGFNPSSIRGIKFLSSISIGIGK